MSRSRLHRVSKSAALSEICPIPGNEFPPTGYKAIFQLGAGLEIAELGVRARFSGPLFLALVFVCLAVSPVLAFPPLDRELTSSTKSFDYGTYSDTNDILMFITNRGWIGHDATGELGRPFGLYYPRGTNKTVIYSAGLWAACRMWKGYRASVAEYEADFTPGPIVDGSFLPDNDKFRAYKIARNDTYDSNLDFAEWPFDEGAPSLKDQAGNDILDELGHRLPRAMGDQTFWCVFNDVNLANHTSSPGSGRPLGMEVQLLAWSDEWPGSLGRTIFLNYTIINKSDSIWREARFGLWADPDIGRASDDLAGCDSALGLGFCYNNGPDVVYGDAPPAVGFSLLAGPSVPSPGDSVWSVRQERWIYGRRALAMNGYAAWTNGDDPTGEPKVYYLLSGKDHEGFPQIDPSNNKPTTFFYSGDPASQSGWLDTSPSDRRFAVGVGPVTVMQGDTIEIVAAVLIGQGTDALGSIASIKQAAATAQALYRGGFDPIRPSTVDILPGACPNIVSFDEPIELEYDFVRPATSIPTSNIVVAVYSTSEYDATAADPREILLGGIAPSGWTVDDIGRAIQSETPCGCGHSTRDGLPDLLLSFDRDEIASALDPLVEGAVRTLTLHTVGRDGARSEGPDCLTFVDLVPESDPIDQPLRPGENDRDAPFALSNQPNPFNAATMVNYRIATDGPVRIEVYDILGRRMATLVDAWQRAGEYQVMWNGTNLHGEPAGSGMYFYRLQSDDGLLSRKMILLK